MIIRVATFNVNNLVRRFRFASRRSARRAIAHGLIAEQASFEILDGRKKRITAKVIRSLKADVIALQEVESLDTVRQFRHQFLGGRKSFPYALCIDGNDPRLIDVAILSRFPIVHVRSHADFRWGSQSGPVFSRDCLEVDLLLSDRRRLTLFVNHLKSMFDRGHPKDGRRSTRARRRRQARAVRKIVRARFGRRPGDHPFIVLGDLNDYLEEDPRGTTAIRDLVSWRQVDDVLRRLPKDERWTHFFSGNASTHGSPDYRQLDYLLLARTLAESLDAPPQIERRGLPLAATHLQGKRFRGVGRRVSGSDHAALVLPVRID